MLKAKALASLVSSIEAFNSPHDHGRITRVLLHLQHAFEMLLKSSLVQANEKNIFDHHTNRSVGFKRCLRLAEANALIRLTATEAGVLRAIDALRDEEQHWFGVAPEQLLYLHARAGVTLFDDLLRRVFDEQLAAHLPTRVLPLSVEPPRELDVILDREYSQISALLQPGRRARHEARARIRTFLAMEAHVNPETIVSDKDVDRVERGIRAGSPRDDVFPRLSEIETVIAGTGVNLTVHFTKKQGAPVRYVSDGSEPTAGIREVDLLRKYCWSPMRLAHAVGISSSRSTALRRHLGLDVDGPFSHFFELDSMHQRRFSDNALLVMREAVAAVDLDAVWQGHKPQGRAKTTPVCTVSGCHAA